MPLILPSLQTELIDIYSKGKIGNPSPYGVGIKTGKAYLNYVSQGMNAGGHPFIAMTGAPNLGWDLSDIYAKTSPDGALTAQKMATAFDKALASWISLFQSTIVTAPGMPGLITDLTDLFSAPKGHTSLFCMALARALHTYTLAAIVIGVTPDTPGIPFTGPIS